MHHMHIACNPLGAARRTSLDRAQGTVLMFMLCRTTRKARPAPLRPATPGAMTKCCVMLLALLSTVTAQGGPEQEPVTVDAMTKYLEYAFTPALAYGQKFAEMYKGDAYRRYTREDLSGVLQNRFCLQNAIAGAGISAAAQGATLASLGLGVPAAIAGQVSASLAASISLQVSLVSAVATIRGFDVYEPRVQHMLLLCILGDVGTEAVKQTMAQMGTKGATTLVAGVSGATLKEINKMLFPYLGMLFITKAGKTGLINLANWIPVVGPAVSFFADGATCKAFSKQADYRVFDGSYLEREELKRWLEMHGLSPLADQLIKNGWDSSSLCDLDNALLQEMGIGGGHRVKFDKAKNQSCPV